MFEKLLSKFKKDKKGGKASKAKKPAAKAASVADDEAGKQTVDAAERKAAEAPSPAAANGNGNGNGKPRVDVIDAMGNSVADMVTNIAKQLSASTEQLSKSRRLSLIHI